MIYSLKYTDDMPEWKAGYTKAWFIRMRPAYRDDLGLLAHAKMHVYIWWLVSLLAVIVLTAICGAIYHFYHPSPYVFCPISLGFFVHLLLYKTCRGYRLWEELKAYKKQLKYAEDVEGSERKFAVRLATNWGNDEQQENRRLNSFDAGKGKRVSTQNGGGQTSVYLYLYVQNTGRTKRALEDRQKRQTVEPHKKGLLF